MDLLLTIELLITIIIIAGLLLLGSMLINNYDKVEKSKNSYRNSHVRFEKPKFKRDLTAADLTRSTKLVNTISVAPRSISALPEKRISIVEGKYRAFQNFYINGQQYSFGFPKPTCIDQRVWIGLNEKEVERISKNEAEMRLKGKDLSHEVKNLLSYNNRSSNKLPDKRSSKVKSKEAHTTGFCNKCSKKLRGDTSKPLCHECWSKGSSRSGKYGHCNSCEKKLRGDKSKALCYACWSDN